MRLGVTPPAAPVLAPHLINLFASQAPHVPVDLQRMWPPKLLDAVATGGIDVALTCGPLPEPAGIAPEVFCAEPLARAICAACPVRGQCLAYAITADERFGIWGGLDPRQRRTLRRRLERSGSSASSGSDRGVTPEQRRLRARIAANARWSRPMARADQADAARTAMTTRLEREVDPAGQLQPDQRAALDRAAERRLSAQLNAAKARKRLSGQS